MGECMSSDATWEFMQCPTGMWDHEFLDTASKWLLSDGKYYLDGCTCECHYTDYVIDSATSQPGTWPTKPKAGGKAMLLPHRAHPNWCLVLTTETGVASNDLPWVTHLFTCMHSKNINFLSYCSQQKWGTPTHKGATTGTWITKGIPLHQSTWPLLSWMKSKPEEMVTIQEILRGRIKNLQNNTCS